MAVASQAVIIPAPPRPPADGVWTVDYGNQLNRWLDNLSRLLGGPFYLRGTGLFFPPGSLPTSGYGLYAGEVFSNAGVLTMVLEGDIWLGSLSATTGLGDLTVTV